MDQWNKIASYYNQLMNEDGDIIRQYLYDPAIEHTLDNVTNKIILDAGCGNGYWSKKLIQRGASQLYCADYSYELIKFAEQKIKDTNTLYFNINLSKKLPFQEEKFDIIISNLVLDYLPTLDTPAFEFHRTLKNNGVLLLGVQHPFYHLCYMLKQTNGDLNKKYQKLIGYFEKGPFSKMTFDQFSLTLYNRTVSDYINIFIEKGLSLEKIIEPEYSEAILQLHPEYKMKSMLPRFLILRFRKQNITL